MVGVGLANLKYGVFVCKGGVDVPCLLGGGGRSKKKTTNDNISIH